MATIALPAARVRAESFWLFSRRLDLAVFLGPAVASALLLLLGWRLGLFEADASPEWVWVPAVLLVDVAHVWSTGFRVYLDGEELRRRPFLYALVPAAGLASALVVFQFGAAAFWRALAYVAVFHFVRQQYGWVALYRGRRREHDRLGHWLDSATIYAATLYPLIYWHAHLPRRFWWFLPGDFAPGVPEAAASVLEPVYWALLASYSARSLWAWVVLRRPNPGKDIVVATTAFCWYAGIVALDSDFAFTVTNVLIHGVPYMALVYVAGRRRAAEAEGALVGRFFALGAAPFLAALWAVAYAEELLWDRSVWLDREWLFGAGWDLSGLEFVIVPLLALPQVTHYLLDGFIWRRKARQI